MMYEDDVQTERDVAYNEGWWVGVWLGALVWIPLTILSLALLGSYIPD